jgi:hypothetical protein
VILADNHEDDITTYAATGVRMRMWTTSTLEVQTPSMLSSESRAPSADKGVTWINTPCCQFGIEARTFLD